MNSDRYDGDNVSFERVASNDIKIRTLDGEVHVSLRAMRKALKYFDELHYDGTLDANWSPTFDVEEPEDF